LSRNLGASASWNPKVLSRLVMGLLYLYPYILRVFENRSMWKILLLKVKEGTVDWIKLLSEEGYVTHFSSRIILVII
jgi:hypothetical protein